MKSEKTIERERQQVLKALEGQDCSPEDVSRITGLGKRDCAAYIHYWKAQGRIENVDGLLHLRPVESTTEQESPEIPAASDAPAPEETPAESEPVTLSDAPPFTPVPTPDTVEIDGWTYHLHYSRLLPPLTPDVYHDLKEDIRQNGIQSKVILVPRDPPEDRTLDVLDGGHRLQIAAELGLTNADIPKDIKQGEWTPEQRESLALRLNLHRRQLFPAQRREYAVRLRALGQSYRQIAETLGAGVATVQRDVKSGDPHGSPEIGEPPVQPDTVTGMDGKTYPAAQPISETQTAKDVEKLRTQFAGKVGISIGRICSEGQITRERTIKALGLMEAQSQVTRSTIVTATPSKPGVALYNFPALVEEVTPPTPPPPASNQVAADSIPPAGDQEPERPAYQAIPGSGTPAESYRTNSVLTAEGVILDALRDSHAQTLVYYGELLKWSNLDPDIFREAFNSLIAKGIVKDGRIGGKHGYHRAEVVDDLLAALPATTVTTTTEGDDEEAASASADLPDALDSLLVDLGAVRMFARAIQSRTIDWSTVEVERRESAEKTIRETYTDLVDLQNHLAQLGIDIKTSSAPSDQEVSA